jgi:hypothetical protein
VTGSPKLDDVLIFAVYLALIAAFLIFLKKGLGISLDVKGLLLELRHLVGLRPTPEALDGLSMVLLSLLELFVIAGILIAPWREAALWLLGKPEGQAIPLLSVLGLLLGLWVAAMIVSQVVCVVFQNRRRN